jgi:hypothetical protein
MPSLVGNELDAPVANAREHRLFAFEDETHRVVGYVTWFVDRHRHILLFRTERNMVAWRGAGNPRLAFDAPREASNDDEVNPMRPPLAPTTTP